jgi:hypothetical protein
MSILPVFPLYGHFILQTPNIKRPAGEKTVLIGKMHVIDTLQMHGCSNDC